MPRHSGTMSVCEGRGCERPAQNAPTLMVHHEPVFWAHLCDECTEKLRAAFDSLIDRRYDPKCGYVPKQKEIEDDVDTGEDEE
jgi:hypothetical protein